MYDEAPQPSLLVQCENTPDFSLRVIETMPSHLRFQNQNEHIYLTELTDQSH